MGVTHLHLLDLHLRREARWPSNLQTVLLVSSVHQVSDESVVTFTSPCWPCCCPHPSKHLRCPWRLPRCHVRQVFGSSERGESIMFMRWKGAHCFVKAKPEGTHFLVPWLQRAILYDCRIKPRVSDVLPLGVLVSSLTLDRIFRLLLDQKTCK